MPASTTQSRAYVTQGEAAEHFGVSVRTIRHYIATGRLPAYRLPGESKGRVRIRRVDLDGLVEPVRVPTRAR